MIIDKDNPLPHLRWYNEDGANRVKEDFNYLSQADVEYFFDEKKTIRDKLSEIRPVGNNDQYHLVCISKGLTAVHIVDFMNWNDIRFDAEKYLN